MIVTATLSDLRRVALTIKGEAEGEPWIGKVAVAWCIRNRVEMDLHGDGKPDWWGEGYETVCMKPSQFSCWPSEALERITTERRPFRDCVAAAYAVLVDDFPDVTDGCTHYVAPKRLAKLPPWTQGRTAHRIIENHHFYKGIG